MQEPYSVVENASVYKLLSKLCEKTAHYYCHQSRISAKQLASKMRSLSYEIILNKSKVDIPIANSDPIVDLLSCHFIMQQRVKNVAEYKHAVELKKAISTIKSLGLTHNCDYVYSVVKVLIGLHDSMEPQDIFSELYQRPFSFGLLEEMLPRPNKEHLSSPHPYPLYPPYVFHLPFQLKSKDTDSNYRKESLKEYTIQNFDSNSLVPKCNTIRSTEFKSLLTPVTYSATSTQISPYSACDIHNLPRLTTPRDLIIPKATVEPKVSLPKTDRISETNNNCMELNELNIWELASQVDKDIPGDIWEIVSKLPSINERQLIATSSREMRLWRQTFGSMTDYNVISERQFIRHITYLLIGIETRSFPLKKQTNSFRLKDTLVLECISRELLEGYVAPLLIIGTYYRRLYEFAFNSVDHDKGLVYEAARKTVRQYLLKFRLHVTEIFEEFSKTTDDVNCMPTLLHILHHIEPLKYEIQTVASIFKVDSSDANTMPYGAELMSYLFNEISLVTHKRTAETLYNSLFIVCRVYFKFIEKFIFEGELDDYFNEFFIRKDGQYVNSRSKRYWDKGFHIALSVAVPDFLRPLASCILLCGKSLRLLKLCNPTDPLILISTDHPSVRCCSTFEELEREQQLLDVYRTRCLFVSGEPVTFDQILLKREAERKAFTEMASLKQAETMEKIIAERKRLAQLIIAEKQHSLRVLEAAMAEAKAAKNRVKQREKHVLQLEDAVDKATEEVDSKLKDDEKNKMLEYYSKLNMEVEKSKIHTEWKIKRLQLDESRMQLLSTEERNLKREKLELEHQRNEEIMAMSIQSDFKSEDGFDETKMIESTSSLGEAYPESELNINRAKSQTSNDVFNAICANKKNDACDNKLELDGQGNIVSTQNKQETSNDVIGGNLNEAFDNQRFLEGREEAFKNKMKVMMHELGDNNLNPIITLTDVDEENNITTAFEEARRNKLKVLGECETAAQKEKIYEPITDAQKEAVINKKRVLGAEFGKCEHLEYQFRLRNEAPITEAQREAVVNKQRVLGVEFDKSDSNEIVTLVQPKTEAQMEAVLNKQKVLGTEFQNIDPIGKDGNASAPINGAHREALLNRQKVLGAEFGRFNHVDLPDSKVIGEPRTEAQKEALLNKQKVLGVEYNLPLERIAEREPANVAQTEALRNKCNVLGSEHYGSKLRVGVKKSGLKLNLKPYGDCSSTGAVTPGELFPGLDLETPTTAEMPTDGPMTSDIFTPRSEDNLEKPERNYLRPEFDFSIIVDEAPSISAQTSPMKDDEKTTLNVLNGSYILENFDPFGVKISKRLEYKSDIAYVDPAKMFAEMKKTPYKNIYKTSIDEDEWILCDNIATLTACLQRSVMLPLTYQLEVVNNSILTHFLVNLDMYDHLKSLKDYFFLMDGEFSRSICNNLFAKLTKTLNPQELLNFSTLHNILDKALGSSISHVHKFSENLSFSIPDVPLSFQHSSPDVLQCLSLTYSVTWPLNIIISQEALVRYAKVFQFLIKMRRIFWVLSQDFELLKLAVKLSPHSRKLLRSPQYISVQLYRHIMASLIRALDNYIVTTCILTSWKEFEKDLKKAKTLDDLYECHVVYIKNVLFRCLLNNRSTPVMKLLNDIFTVILKFSRVLKAGEWQQKEKNDHFTHTNFAQLEELYHLYEKLTKYLHKVITKLMECGYQRHLVELLTMVNLNGYYDPERHENTSVA